MKLRTKLIGLLSALLLLVILTTTLGGFILLSNRVDTLTRSDAEATAQDIANNLQDYLGSERSDDEVRDRLESLKQRHPAIVKLALFFATDAGETVRVVLPLGGDPEVSRLPLPRRGHGDRAQLYDGRRALWEHGDNLRAPGSRGQDPLWRLNDRGTSSASRWNFLVPLSVRRNADMKTLEDTATCPPQKCLTISIEFDPAGPQRGKLAVTVKRDRYSEVLRNQLRISVVTTLAALLVLLLSTAWIVNRVVAQPVDELEQAMREVEQGDLRRRVATQGRDEIGNLSRGFNAMLDRLAQADEEIRALNSRLADDIAAATRDLQHKNEALSQLNQLLVQIQRDLGDKERLAALGQLAAQLAHEVGTPLASVSGHLQLAAYSRDLPPALRERLQMAIGELGRVSKIIRDYLDQTRTAKPTLVPTDLRRVVEEAVRVATTAAKLPLVRIVSDIDPEVAELHTDPGLVRQILINLLTNALDATASAQASAATPGRVVISVRPGDDIEQVEISVRDHAAGISPDDLARIFEPFYTTKGRGRGTGLGLSICRELARALGGKITVQSAPGDGSDFAVVLPRKLVHTR